MNHAEQKYTHMEKTCSTSLLSKSFVIYFLIDEVYLIVHDNPVLYFLLQLALSGRAARWLLRLVEFNIKCVTEKALHELLATYPSQASTPAPDTFNVGDITFTTWMFYFHGSVVGLQGGGWLERWHWCCLSHLVSSICMPIV